jgi:hypothetical protein
MLRLTALLCSSLAVIPAAITKSLYIYIAMLRLTVLLCSSLAVIPAAAVLVSLGAKKKKKKNLSSVCGMLPALPFYCFSLSQIMAKDTANYG